MQKIRLPLSLLAVAIFTVACSTTPPSNQLEQAREDYRVLQSSPMVATYAPLELKQAGDALQQANTSAANHDSQDKLDKLAYVAKQKIALTQEVTKQKMAEAESAQSSQMRDQMRLEQRTAEADRAKMNTRIAEGETAEAKRAAQAARDQAQSAKQTTQLALADAAASQRAAEDAQAKSAQLEAQLKDLAARKTERGIVITLGDVLFGTDLARLNAEGQSSAQKLATLLQQNPQRTVLVEGFTDSTGTSAHNQELSERRADAVRASLREMGVAPERITMRGYGETLPVAGNDTAANRQLNRRVEIVLSDANGKITPR